MSYDPRGGSSPYLGMDPDTLDETAFSSPEVPVAPDTPTTTFASGSATNTPHLDDFDPGRTRVAPASRRQTGAARVAPTVRRANEPVPARKAARPIPRNVAPVASPQQQPYRDAAAPFAAPRVHKGGPLAYLASFLLHILAFGLRLLAIAFSVFVVASALLTSAHRTQLVSVLNLTAWLVPSSLFGRLVYETPFGGALRGDLICASLLLFLADYLCLRFATSLVRGERGA